MIQKSSLNCLDQNTDVNSFLIIREPFLMLLLFTVARRFSQRCRRFYKSIAFREKKRSNLWNVQCCMRIETEMSLEIGIPLNNVGGSVECLNVVTQ